MKSIVISLVRPITALLPGPGYLSKSAALGICVLITLTVMMVEIAASYLTNSLMLFSDGLHMLSHALSLGISLGAIFLGQQKASLSYPFGWGRIEIVAALINGLGLALFTLYIFYESTLRLISPMEINVSQTLMIAILGLVVNLSTAYILNLAGLEDLNTKSAFMHLLADTFSSLAIIIGCVVISFTNWYWIDPLLSIVVGVVIAKWSYGLIRDATRILLNKVPDSIDLQEIEQGMLDEFVHISHITELKVWQPTPDMNYLTACIELHHLELMELTRLRHNLKQYLKDVHGIEASTLEFLIAPEFKVHQYPWVAKPGRFGLSN